MPQQNEPQSSPWILILIITAGFFWWANTDKNSAIPKPPDDDKNQVEPVPVPTTEPTEAAHWNALALCVDRSSFGVLQQHTDHLLAIVDILKSTGSIKDDGRVSEWRAKRIEITDANRAEVAKKLRGI
jgi:hypothetical protein